jgi:hypothetical protein
MTGLRAQGDSSILNQVNQSARSFFFVAAIARLFCLFFLLASLISAQARECKHVFILMGEDSIWRACRLKNENAIFALRPGWPEGSLIFSEYSTMLLRMLGREPWVRSRGDNSVRERGIVLIRTLFF